MPLPTGTRRVLVIDDEPAVLKVLGLVLQRRGFAVDTMSSAKAALAQLPQQKYHAILSDIIMPEMSGVEFLRELRRHDLDVPVILMTAGPTLDSAIDAIEYGAQQYLLKPVEPDALVKAVGRAVALGELARACASVCVFASCRRSARRTRMSSYSARTSMRSCSFCIGLSSALATPTARDASRT